MTTSPALEVASCVIFGEQTVVGGVVSTTVTVDKQVDESPLLLVTPKVTLQLPRPPSLRVGVALVAFSIDPPGPSVLHE